MKTKTLFLLYVVSLALLSGCKKNREPIPEVYSHYIGLWQGENASEIFINADGSGSLFFEKKEGNRSSSKSADIANVFITDSTLVFKFLFGIKFTLPVNEPPLLHGDVVHMQVDGVWFDLVEE